MVIDASAIIALLNREARAGDVAAAIEAHRRGGGQLFIAPTGLFESVLGLARARTANDRKPKVEQISKAREAVDALIADLKIEEVPCEGATARKAIDAAARFGLAVGHPAQLNFGDCFAYAAALERRAKLLFIGNDFSRTDAASAIKDAGAG